MKWTQHGHTWRSGDYQILSGIRGWSVWIYAEKESKKIADDIPTCAAAMTLAKAYALRTQG